MTGVEGVFTRLGDVYSVGNGSSLAEKWTSISPCLEVRGAFFTLFDGKLKILGDDGLFQDSPITGAAELNNARHYILQILYRRSPHYPPHSVPALARSSTKRYKLVY